MMYKKISTLMLCLFCALVVSAQSQKSDLQQKAESELEDSHLGTARSLFIRAYHDYVNHGKVRQGVECAAQAATLYYKENEYQEAFDFLRDVDQLINNKLGSSSERAAAHYYTSKVRMQMYVKLKRGASAQDHLNAMSTHAAQSDDEEVKNDMLYNKAIYYYTFGQTTKGNEVFREMATKLTAQKEYDKVDEVYQTLIANGRKSNSASLVDQSYKSYLHWKDSIQALKTAEEVNALKKQIADDKTAIDEKDSSLTVRMAIIIGLGILSAILAIALVVGGIMLLRYILLTRRQERTITEANENIALKAKFISNISAQLEPTFRKLDSKQPEVKALLNFSQHIQTLSALESSEEEIVLEDTQVPQFCESIAEQVRGRIKDGITFNVNAPKMTASMNREYVSQILLHLLENAIQYTPKDGTITLEFKKKSPKSYQFLVSDTGEGIPEEKCDSVFRPFVEVHDLTKGDGLGLPICRQMALNMKGELSLDPQYTKGTRFVLDLQA